MTIKNYLFLALLLVQLMFATTVLGQSTAPTARTPGAPAGSYSLSDFESVNLFSGNLNVSLPLLSVNGRGNSGQTLALTIETQWNVEREATGIPDNWDHIITPRTPWPVGFIGQLNSETIVDQLGEEPCGGGGNWTNHRFNFTFVDADGTEHMLVDPNYHGRPYKLCGSNTNNYGRIFQSTNGEFMTFVSDVDTWSWGDPTGYLHYKDGRMSRIVLSRIQWTQDRNGNRTVYEYEPNNPIFYPPLATKITDSIGRQITIAYDVNEGSPYGLCDKITYKGFQGATRTIRISKGLLQNFLRTTQIYDSSTIKTKGELFPDEPNDSNTIRDTNVPHNPFVIGVVWLPDGRTYQFKYNVYGRLARIVLPTGGAFEYDYEPSSLNGPGGPDVYITNRVNQKRIYKDGTTLESLTTFSGSQASQGFPAAGMWGWVVDVEQFDHLGTRLTKTKHFFRGLATGSWGYVVPWWNGREVQTEFFAANGTTVLKRVVNDWRQIIPTWCYNNFFSPCGPNPPDTAPTINPFILETKTTLVDANLVTKSSALKPNGSFGFDSYNNPTDRYEYDFGVGAVGPLKRHTQWTYLNTSPYTSNNVHILNLPTRMSVYDAAETEQARTTYEYDVYSGTNHAALKDWSSVTGVGMFGQDPAFTASNVTRGNLTAASQYFLSGGTVTGSISSFIQYDLAGNPVKTIDANGNATTFDYLDCFGAPNGEARTNGVSGLTGTGFNSYAFATVVTNAFNHKTYSQFDYYLGQAVDAEDANGAVASVVLNDAFDRPTQIKRAVGTAKENQTTYSYDDTNRIISASSDRDSNNDNILVSKTVYDPMGRTTEIRQYEGGSNYIVTQTQYNDLGRAFKVSNPFRPWQSETAVWSTQAFDALGRVISATTPDNATVTSTYNGNTVTVTDQAGRARKSVSDGLGRLLEIYEDPAGQNYQTSYAYDVLDNLVKVTQGTQQRFFKYDSLSRLIRTRNPEQSTLTSLNLSDPITGNSAWTIGYQYDATGNLTQKTDARGIISTYAYDALNRNTTTDYSDTATINPDVSRFYDGATNGKGRLWYSYAGGNETSGSKVEKTLLESYDVLGQPLTLKQLFKANGVWSSAYQTLRAYNLAGAVTSQTYPSIHTVTYNYDAAGRLADKDASNLAFAGNLGDGVQRTYSKGITYVSAGQLKQEQFGTSTSIYQKRFYNSRHQLAEILASTTGGDSSWNRGKIINAFSLQCSGAGCNATDNNSNLRKQEIYIPANDQVSSYTSWYQQYDYDALNRLQRVHEYTGNTSLDWQQEYSYDRWGNRTIHQTNTFGTAINKKNFAVDTATNRLTVPAGQSGTMGYDSAGNLTTDTYTGAGARTYDAEGQMTSAQDNSSVWAFYTYNANGQRTRRTINNQETWQVYGFDSELLAEYGASAPVTSPQKEYGYRNGELLITAEGRTNVALAANGGVASASSAHTCCGFSVGGAINGNIRGPWGNGEGWNDATENVLPDWFQVDFAGNKTIDEIDVFSLHDNYTAENTPTETQTFSLYGLVNFQVQYWDGSAWTTVTGGGVTGNNKVWRKFTFSPITTSKIRLWITSVPDSWSRLVELQAWAAVGSTPRANFAASANGGTATASETHSTPYAASGAINGDRKLYTNNAWANVTATYPQWLQVDFNGSKDIDEVDVFSIQDNPGFPSEPTLSMTFSLYGLTAFQVQYWNGSAWTTVPNGQISGNNKVWKQITFSPITTSKVRVLITGTGDGYSRLAEVEAWGVPAGSGGSSSTSVHWLITDQLGTPRMVLDQSGNLANVKRHDYLPFGEELFAQQGLRSAGLGYTGGDGVRQQFTEKERDVETGLDYFGARYYASTQGRFTSPDPLLSSGRSLQPQSWNRYTYVLNRPLSLVDLNGLDWGYADWTDDQGVRHRDYHYFTGDIGNWNGHSYTAVDFGGDATRTLDLYDGRTIAIANNSDALGGRYMRDVTAHPQAEEMPVLPASWMDYVPVLGSSRQFLFNYTTHNFEGALIDFSKLSVEIGAAVAGGAVAAGSDATTVATEEATTTLYRAVGQAEYEQLMETGAFQAGPNSLGGKWFAETAKHASQWGEVLEGKGAFKVVDAKIPTVQANQFMRVERLDGIGPARYAELNQLKNAVIGKGP